MDSPPEEPDSRFSGHVEPLEVSAPARDPAEDHSIVRFVKQLGTLLGSGGLIGVLGKIVGASDAQVAALTLCVVACAYVIIYRERIQSVLKSYVIIVAGLIGLLIGILCSRQLFSLLLSQTITKSTGIVEYSAKANDFLPRLREFMRNAHDEIWLTGISFYITVPANKDALMAKLDEGVSVRFLIYNPLSPNLEEVARGFNQTRGELASECEVTIQNLRGMLLEARQKRAKGSLEIRLFSNIPKARLYVFDRRSEAGYTYFIPHIDNQNSPNLPGFLVRNTRTGIAPAYFEGIERLWSQSITFESFLQNYDVSRQH
jgi:hypothetical protein